MTDHPIIAEAMASATELIKADERLRVITRGGLTVPPDELNALCFRVVKLSQQWEQTVVRIQTLCN